MSSTWFYASHCKQSILSKATLGTYHRHPRAVYWCMERGSRLRQEKG